VATKIDALDLPLYAGRDDLEPEANVAQLGALEDAGWLAKWSLGYLVTRYDDVVALLRERSLHQASQLVAAALGGDTSTLSQLRRESILSAEGETHTRLRRLVAAPFSPRAIDQLRPFMASYLDEQLTRLAPGQARFELEFASTFSQYPIAVICHHLGVERGDWDLFSQWAETTFLVFSSSIKGNEQRVVDESRAFTRYCVELIDERREHPGEDLLSTLIGVEEAGDRLSTDELVSLVQGIIAAGTDTTRNQLNTMVALLAREPDRWRALGDEHVETVVEESLRYLNPIRFVIRQVAEEFVYRDVVFPVGALVAFNLAGVNRDGARFADADVFDPWRESARQHLTFSSGIHHCLGAALARAELQEALRALRRHWSTLELTGEVTWKDQRLAVWGAKHVALAVTRV